MSPYEALFADKPPMGPLGIPHPPSEHDNFKEFYGARRQQILDTRKSIQQMIARAQDTVVIRKNAHAHRVPFKIGDWVLRKNQNPKTKWDPKFLGPWRVTDVISPVVFEIDMDGKPYTVHATYLKAYNGTPPTDGVTQQETSDQDDAEENEEPEEDQQDYGFWPEPQYEEGSYDQPVTTPLRQSLIPWAPQEPSLVQRDDGTLREVDMPTCYVDLTAKAPSSATRSSAPLQKVMSRVSRAARKAVRFRLPDTSADDPEGDPGRAVSPTLGPRNRRSPQRLGEWTT
jgi:hypothetical protein